MNRSVIVVGVIAYICYLLPPRRREDDDEIDTCDDDGGCPCSWLAADVNRYTQSVSQSVRLVRYMYGGARGDWSFYIFN